jgi:DNA-binding PadR family transcriptional regulator
VSSGDCTYLAVRPRFGLELVRDLAAADGLLTSDGTVYPLLNRLRDAGLVTSEWRDEEGQRARRYYSITTAGRKSLAELRAGRAQFVERGESASEGLGDDQRRVIRSYDHSVGELEVRCDLAGSAVRPLPADVLGDCATGASVSGPGLQVDQLAFDRAKERFGESVAPALASAAV